MYPYELIRYRVLRFPRGGENEFSVKNGILGNGIDLYSDLDDAFNEELLQSLLNSLTGKQNAKMSDIQALFDAEDPKTTTDADIGTDPNSKWHYEYGSKVVKASTLNINSGDADNGIVITLHGFEWRISSLTIDNNGNVVASLMLKDPEPAIPWFSNANQNTTHDSPSTMYSTSDIRNKVLLDPLGKFSKFAIGEFANNYLIQPKNIEYQRKQSLHNRRLAPHTNSLPNDALGEENYNDFNYTTSETENFNFHNKQGYADWGEDRIWLPSITETGSTQWTDNIWGMNVAQLKFTNQSYTWLRSGSEVKAAESRILTGSGSWEDSVVTAKRGLRPAVHLNLSAATQKTVKTDLWDSENNKFNNDKLNNLIDKLTGKNNSTIENLEELIENTLEADNLLLDCKVVKAPTINANANSIDEGIVIFLNGLEWIVTSLVFDDRGDVVATLLLKTPLGTAPWNLNGENAATTDEPSNMYSSSSIRKYLTQESQDFQFFAEGSFAERYLVQPNYIKYQRTQDSAKRDYTDTKLDYSLPNDALGTDSTGFRYYTNSDYHNKPLYSEWGKDFIWLPSINEVGTTRATNSIWGLPITHSGFVTSDTSIKNYMTRSAYYNSNTYPNYAYQITKAGAHSDSATVEKVGGVRPAIHLNLSAADGEYSPRNPEDIESVYNGEDVELGELDVLPRWYRADSFGNPSKIMLSYYRGNDTITNLGGVNSVGEYWVKAEIMYDWIAEGELLGEEVKFIGTPDTGDPNHMESDTVRWFKWVVKPKEITVSPPTFDEATGVVSPPMFADLSEFVDSNQPTLAVRYYGTSTSGDYHHDEINVMPTRRGNNYTAQAIFVNSATDLTPYAGNYVIKDESNIKCNFIVGRTKLNVPKTAQSEQNYAGADLEFELVDYNAELSELIEMILPDGVNLVGNDADGWRLTVKNAGVYEIKCRLKDYVEYSWAGSIDDITEKKFTITVNRRELTVEFISTHGFNFQTGEKASINADVKALVNDKVVLYIEYYDKLNSDVKVPISGQVFDASQLPPGDYTIQATLRDSDDEINKNYFIKNEIVSQDFTVTKVRAILPSEMSWLYSQNNGDLKNIDGGVGNSQGNPFVIAYNGVTFDFEVSTAQFEEWGIQVKTYSNQSAYKNATSGVVSVTMSIEPKSGFAFLDENGAELPTQTKEFVLYLQIAKAKFDLSSATWGLDELEYNNRNQKIEVSNLPHGLSVEYVFDALNGITNTAKDAGKYTAKIDYFDVSDPENWVVPTEDNTDSYIGNFEWSKGWEITKKKIASTWTTVPYGEPEFKLPVISGTWGDLATGQIKYTYYLMADDGTETLLDSVEDITISPGVRTRYKVKAEVDAQFINNYELAGTTAERIFTIGDSLEEVVVGLATTEFTYDGEPKSVIVTNDCDLTATDFAIAYLDALGQPLADNAPPTNAGAYKVEITLAGNAANEFHIADGIVDFVITPAVLSLDGVRWGYDAADPFVYEWLDGAAVEHVVTLEGLSGKLADVVSYTDNAKSQSGSYTAKAAFALTGDDAINYTIDADALAALQELEWVIGARQFAKPLATASQVFDNTEHDLANFAELNSGWEEYFDINFTKNGVAFDSSTARDAGIYTIRFVIKSVHGGNVEWVGGDIMPEITTLTLEQREVKIEGWSGGKPPRASIDSSHADFYKTVYTDPQGNEIAIADMAYNVTYRAEILPKDGMGGNVVIKAAEGLETFAEFIRFDPASPPQQVDMPTNFSIVIEYDDRTGNLTWEDLGGRAEDAEYVVLEGSLRMVVGTYVYKAHINSTKNAVWADGTDIETVLEINVEIVPRKILLNWVGSPPTLGTDWDMYLEYKYFDMSDNEITNHADFVDGVKYKAKAFIRTEYAENYGFWDGSEYVPSPVEYEFDLGSAVEVTKPTLQYNGGTVLIIEYDGAEHTFELVGFVDAHMSQSGDNLTQKNAGKYSITVSLKSGAKWDDGTTASVLLEFEITKKKIAVPTVGASLTFNGSEQLFTPDGLDSAWVTAGGVLNGTNAGTYNATFTLSDPLNTEWAGGTVVGDTVTIEWTIGKLILDEWTTDENGFKTLKGLTDELVQNNAISYRYYDADGKEVAQDKLVEGEIYTVKAELAEKFRQNYGLGSVTGFTMEFENFALSGGGIGNGDGDGGGIANNLPLWQIIATAAGLLLGLIFFGISISNGAKTRKLRSETSEKTTQFNTFAALPLLSAALSGGEKFIGMSSTVWTILACVALAFGVCGLGTMLITGRQKNAAAQKLEKAERAEREEKQARIAREERLEREEAARAERRQREEERQQRDNEMKMMFMMMSKRGGGATTEDGPIVYRNAPPTQDVKEIVTQVVAALMPGMQAQLPPTSANTNNDTLEILVKQQMQVLDRQTKIIENFEKKMGREKSDDDEEGG